MPEEGTRRRPNAFPTGTGEPGHERPQQARKTAEKAKNTSSRRRCRTISRASKARCGRGRTTRRNIPARQARRTRSRSSPAATAASAARSRSRWRARAPMSPSSIWRRHDDAQETQRLVEEEGARVPADRRRRRRRGCSAARRSSRAVERVRPPRHPGQQRRRAAPEDDDSASISAEQLERTFRTNMFCYFHMTQRRLQHMQQGARDHQHDLGHRLSGQHRTLIDYAATKGAIVAFTRSLSQALVEQGHPRQRRRAGADLDAADPVDVLGREGRRASARTCRWGAPASRTRSRPATCSSPARTPPT